MIQPLPNLHCTFATTWLSARVVCSLNLWALTLWALTCFAAPSGKVSLAMYKAAQGIEAYVYEDKIEDADAGWSPQ